MPAGSVGNPGGNMALVSINFKPEKKDIRNFAYALAGGFTIIAWGLWLLGGHLQSFRESGTWSWGPLPLLWGIPLAIAALSLISPKLGKPFYMVWMGFGFVMGTFMSYVVLTLFFYLVITPTGLVLRIAGYDPLRIRKPIKGSNWVDRERPYTKDNCHRLY